MRERMETGLFVEACRRQNENTTRVRQFGGRARNRHKGKVVEENSWCQLVGQEVPIKGECLIGLDRYRAAEGRTGSGVAVAQAVSPRVVVMDLGMPGMNGIEATRCIKDAVPASHVVILTIHNSKAYRADAADAGVSAYVPKEEMEITLVPTLRALLSDRTEPRPEVEA